MSEEPRQPAPPSKSGLKTDPLREVRHDLRHSLYVLDLALTLLAESRADEARFSEVLGMLRKEQATINRLMEELLQHVSGKSRAEGHQSGSENRAP